MSSTLDKIANDYVPDEPVFEDLPPDAWVAAMTCTVEDGGWAAKVSPIQTRDGRTLYSFRVGLSTIGGDSKILDKHRRQRIGMESFIHPSPEYDKAGALLAGKFAGFLNAVFSPGVGDGIDTKSAEGKAKRSAARWANTVALLARVGEEKGISEAAYLPADPDPQPDGSLSVQGMALYVAGLAVAALESESRSVLFKTKTRTFTNKDNEKISRVEVRQVEDFTPANVLNRKVAILEGEAGPAAAAPTTTF